MGVLNLFRKKKIKKETRYAKKVIAKRYKLGKHEFQEWQKGSEVHVFNDIKPDGFSLSKTYLDLLERYIPNVGGAIWTWKKLCNTQFEMNFEGGTERQRNEANKIFKRLNQKINPIKSVKNGGFNNLLSIYYEHLFKYGRTSGSLIIDENMSEIKTYKVYNPYDIRFTKNLTPIIVIENKWFKLNENTFYYYAQNMDTENPYGISMLESCPSLVKINDDLLRDMANSSSNAGVPRLHIKIDQPEQLDKEPVDDYIERANRYFDDTVDNLSSIGSDENFYTWKDMEIAVAGGSQGATGFVWRINRQMIDEEMITAFKLYPWVLAKSTGTTKNWVSAQYDLLMNEVDSVQNEAKNFVEWITAIELTLHGLTDIKPKGKFDRMRDPAMKEFAVGNRFKIDNVITKVKTGMIDPDTGARELGIDKWYDKKLIPKDKSLQEKPKSRVDESEGTIDTETEDPEKDKKD